MGTPLYNLRPAEGGDVNFILNSWLRRYREAISARLVTDAVYYATQHKVIRAILAQPELRVLVACSPDDSSHIFGYAVGSDFSAYIPGLFIVHFVYVKAAFRRFGVAKALCADLIGDRVAVHYSHRTHLLPFIDRENKWVFNPTYVWSLL